MLKAAIHGMGRWGGRLIDSVQGSEKIRLVKGVSRNPAAHRELAAKTGIALTESYTEVLRDSQIDAVVLATPHSQHFEQIVQAAQAGKHVYVEKPIPLTRETRSANAARSSERSVSAAMSRTPW